MHLVETGIAHFASAEADMPRLEAYCRAAYIQDVHLQGEFAAASVDPEVRDAAEHSSGLRSSTA